MKLRIRNLIDSRGSPRRHVLPRCATARFWYRTGRHLLSACIASALFSMFSALLCSAGPGADGATQPSARLAVAAALTHGLDCNLTLSRGGVRVTRHKDGAVTVELLDPSPGTLRETTAVRIVYLKPDRLSADAISRLRRGGSPADQLAAGVALDEFLLRRNAYSDVTSVSRGARVESFHASGTDWRVRVADVPARPGAYLTFQIGQDFSVKATEKGF